MGRSDMVLLSFLYMFGQVVVKHKANQALKKLNSKRHFLVTGSTAKANKCSLLLDGRSRLSCMHKLGLKTLS